MRLEVNSLLSDKFETAGLLHAIDWDLLGDDFELSEFIKICRTQGSQVGILYQQLCEKHQIDAGVGPWDYELFVLIRPGSANDYPMFGDPYALLDRICNVIALVLAHPIPMCRVIFSRDNFQTCSATYETFQYGTQTDFLMVESVSIDRERAAEITAAWQTVDSLSNKKLSTGRVYSALTYFYYAWRSPYMDQCCLNLSVCLELLFSPQSQGEISHQISFNVARFLGSSPSEMRAIYRAIRNFYGVRSRIVHGGLPDDGKVVEAAMQAFKLCSDCLRKLLLNGFANVFDNDKRRRELMDSFMFR